MLELKAIKKSCLLGIRTFDKSVRLLCLESRFEGQHVSGERRRWTPSGTDSSLASVLSNLVSASFNTESVIDQPEVRSLECMSSANGTALAAAAKSKGEAAVLCCQKRLRLGQGCLIRRCKSKRCHKKNNQCKGGLLRRVTPLPASMLQTVFTTTSMHWGAQGSLKKKLNALEK